MKSQKRSKYCLSNVVHWDVDWRNVCAHVLESSMCKNVCESVDSFPPSISLIQRPGFESRAHQFCFLDTWIDTIFCENNENKIKTKRPFLNLYGNCHTYFERSVNMFSQCPFCFSNLGIENCIDLWCVCLNILPNFCRWMDPTSESGPDK